MNENITIPTKQSKNRAEYSCHWCGGNGICENRQCVMNGLACDGSRDCSHYRESSYSERADVHKKAKRWHKVKTMYDTYLPNARYY